MIGGLTVEEVVPVLRRMATEDPSEEVRKAAVEAMDEITGGSQRRDTARM